MAPDPAVNRIDFAAPWYLLLLAVSAPALGYALVRWERRREALLRRFGDESVLARSSSLPSRRHRRARDLVSLCAVVLILLALARPQWGERPSSTGRQGRDLLVLLDLSRSMNASDAGRVRLTAAKQLIKDLLARTPGYRVGLVVFGGSAFLQLPLTTNYAAFERFLDAASTDDLGDPGTDLSSALSAAATVFEHEGQKGYQSVLLISDGENGPGDPGPLLNRLRKAGVSVVAVGVGGTEGAPVPADSSEAPEKWHRDNIGRIVLSRLEEGDLRRAARETGGAYYRWSPEVSNAVALALSRLDRRTISASEQVERVDRFQWPLGLGLALLLLWPLATLSRREEPL
jgi:Ca-activated chloride channel homolog